MHKSKIIIDKVMLDQITGSLKIGESEKIAFLRHVWYLTKEEKEELSSLI